MCTFAKRLFLRMHASIYACVLYAQLNIRVICAQLRILHDQLRIRTRICMHKCTSFTQNQARLCVSFHPGLYAYCKSTAFPRYYSIVQH